MKYELIGSNDFIFNPMETILKNRGIQDIEKFLNLDESVVHDYKLLKNINIAVKCLIKHVENKSTIYIQCDSDQDGFSSASIIYLYLKRLEPTLNILWGVHDGKKHGLKDLEIPKGVNLVISPDGGSNDYGVHKELKTKGIDIIVLDHHEAEYESKHAIIVNNQIDDYPNKNLSGAGIVYKFCKALDDETWNDYADDYLDLVATGNIADMMDLRELETRYYVEEGLKNIKNKFLKALIQKQEYSIKGEVTPISIAFYISPLINATTRIGTKEENENMFKAFIETDETVMYKPRGKKEEVEVSLISDMASVCSNIKAKQNRSRDKSVNQLEKDIELDSKIILINSEDKLDDGLAGLVANQFSNKYMRPTIIVKEVKDKKGKLGGSARGYDKGEIKDFKSLLSDIKLIDYATGHRNAFGTQFNQCDFDKLKQILNEKLKNVSCENVFQVDFLLEENDIDKFLVEKIHNMRYLWGRGIDEPLISIKNVSFAKDDIFLMGAKENTIKMHSNEMVYMLFKTNKEIHELLTENENVTLDIVGKASINEYNGNKTAQIIIEDFNIK